MRVQSRVAEKPSCIYIFSLVLTSERSVWDREKVEFSQFIREEGFTIIPISEKHQLAYACNVLNLGNSRILSVHAPTARQIVRAECFKGDVQVTRM